MFFGRGIFGYSQESKKRSRNGCPEHYFILIKPGGVEKISVDNSEEGGSDG